MVEFEQLSFLDDEKPLFKIKNPIMLIELFAGVGSQAMALRDLGADFEHYRVVELDKYAIKSYNSIHGTEFPKMDITQIHGSDLGIEDVEKFTYLMTYSFPCQDLSVAGKQKGMAKDSGTRSGLLWEVERLLNEVENLPQVLLMENVPQVHGKKNIEDFQNWISFLESKGYSNYWQDLNAKNYGVAQNRNRCFMVSILGDWKFTFPEPIELKRVMKDYLEDVVDEKYYINNEKAQKLIQKLIDNGTLQNTIPTDGQTDRRTDGQLTELSISQRQEQLEIVSKQGMMPVSAICGQTETVLLKAIDLSLNNPKEKDISNCILSHVSKDGNSIGKYASLNNGVIECKM
ncbi:DNA (cytosine-5-)-methyltransferase [[Ruminococcus] torques]|uniref:DNA (cytosine-5-)-methyltransferase n=1 Tax=[Ruminococcus] torques TaxID=33039 RepID=UPI002060E932|nr:MAG TPA: Cytosine specific methyltransferase [Bacteriophage sp.]